MHLPNRLDKVTGRYRELTGKSFDKISESKIKETQVIEELQQSLAELKASPNPNLKQIDRIQSMLIQQIRNRDRIKK